MLLPTQYVVRSRRPDGIDSGIELSDKSRRNLLANALLFHVAGVKSGFSSTNLTQASNSRAVWIRIIDFSTAPALLSTYYCVTIRNASAHNVENQSLA